MLSLVQRNFPLLANFLFPPAATVALGEHSPLTNDGLTATATDSDPYGKPVTLTYVWTVNGAVKQTFVSTALTDSFNLSVPGNGDKGDTIVVAADAQRRHRQRRGRDRHGHGGRHAVGGHGGPQ